MEEQVHSIIKWFLERDNYTPVQSNYIFQNLKNLKISNIKLIKMTLYLLQQLHTPKPAYLYLISNYKFMSIQIC